MRRIEVVTLAQFLAQFPKFAPAIGAGFMAATALFATPAASESPAQKPKVVDLEKLPPTGVATKAPPFGGLPLANQTTVGPVGVTSEPAAEPADTAEAAPSDTSGGNKQAEAAPGTNEPAPQASAPAPETAQEMAKAPASQTAPVAASEPAPDAAPQSAMAPPIATEPEFTKEAAAETKGRDSEGRLLTRLHPLQSARPNRNIVVCEAGCDGTRVIYDGPRAVAAGDVSEKGAAFNSTCKGGCYANPPGQAWAGYDRSRAADMPNGSTPAPRLLDGEGRWLSNEIQGNEAPVSSQASGVRSGILPVPAGGDRAAKSAKPEARKRDDWMARINSERKSERAGSSQQQSAE